MLCVGCYKYHSDDMENTQENGDLPRVSRTEGVDFEEDYVPIRRVEYNFNPLDTTDHTFPSCA